MPSLPRTQHIFSTSVTSYLIIVIWLGLICSLLCYIPVFSGQKFSYYEQQEYNIMVESITSENSQLAMAVSIGATIPLIIDFIRTSFTSIYDKSASQDWPFRLLLLALVIPNFITYFFICPLQYVEMIPCVISSQSVLLFTAEGYALIKYGSNIWKPYKVILFLILVLVSIVLGNHIGFVPFEQKDAIDIIHRSLQALAAAIFVYLSLKWLYYIYHHKLTSISYEDHCCATYLLLGYGIFGRLLVGIAGSDSLSDTMQDLCLVRPYVLVHAVRKDTGMYLRGKGSGRSRSNGNGNEPSPAARPLCTSVCPLKLATSIPNWKEELVIDIQFSLAVHPHSLLLFEILDMDNSDHMEVNPSSDEQHPSPRRKVAWAFLLPVSQDKVGGNVNNNNSKSDAEGRVGGDRYDGMTVNVGICPSWFNIEQDKDTSTSTRQKSSRKARALKEEEEAAVNEDIFALLGNKDLQELPVQHEGDLKLGPLIGEISSNYDLPLRLQLYCYKQEGCLSRLQRRELYRWTDMDSDNIRENINDTSVDNYAAYPDRVPDVYWQWRRRKLIPLVGVLSISTGCRIRDDYYNGDNGNSTGQEVHSGRKSARLNERDGAVLQRSRGVTEPCLPPDRLLHRLYVGPEGAMVACFSHNGTFLAVASPSTTKGCLSTGSTLTAPDSSKAYALRIFDPDFGKERFIEEIAHHGVIYDIKWSLSDNFLVTCSGDGRCKIWEVSIEPYVRLEHLTSSPFSSKKHGTTWDHQDNLFKKHHLKIPVTVVLISLTFSPSLSHFLFYNVYIHLFKTGGDTVNLSGSFSSRNELGGQYSDGRPSTPGATGTPRLLKSLRTDGAHLRCTPLHVLNHLPPVFIYTAIFQEYSSSQGRLHQGNNNTYPRIISGASDGRIR
eukprot:gene2781-5478_t